MDKKLCDSVWKILPSKFREEVKQIYQAHTNRQSITSQDILLDKLFGRDNLTSDTEPEKVMVIPLQAFCSLCADADDYINEHIMEDSSYEYYQGRSDALHELASYKCLPDKELRLCDKCANESWGYCNINTVCDGALMPTDDRENCDDYKSKQPSVQGEPKFKIGDFAYVIFGNLQGTIRRILACTYSDTQGWEYDIGEKVNKKRIWFSESSLAPYTEPETKDNMEEKELNRKALYNALCELEKASIKVRKALKENTEK